MVIRSRLHLIYFILKNLKISQLMNVLTIQILKQAPYMDFMETL